MYKTLAALRARRDEDEGFTLIELMVVVLIIAILIAIAIPTFLGARQRAQDKAAQSSLRNALTAAKTLYTDSETYASATNAALVGVEPSLTFVTPSDSAKKVSVDTSGAPNVIVLAAFSASTKCFYMRDNTNGPGTEFAASPSGKASCDATAPDVTGVAWNSNGW